jgi:hypothetical protein
MKNRYYILIPFTVLILLAAAFISTPAISAGSVRYVAPGGACGSATPCYSSVQAAVNAAVAGDEIRIAAGTYTGVNSSGGHAQHVNIAKSLTIKGGYTTSNWTTPNPGTNTTTWHALSQGRAVYISGSYNVTITGIHMVFGSSTGLGWGGGVYIEGATVTLRQVWVTNNSAPSGNRGGGIFVIDAVITVQNSTIQDNVANDGGGGIHILNSQATLTDNLIAENISSSYTSMPGGGGVLIGGVSQVSMTGNTIRDNTAGLGSRGGGISMMDNNTNYHGDMNLTLTNNTIEGNEAGVGGGVHITEYFGASVDLFVYATITGNTIQDNYTTYSGAGISAGATDVTITGNTIINNHAGVEKGTGYVNYGRGGGLSVSGKASIINNLIQGNEAKGIAGEGMGGGANLNGTITFRGNEVKGNLAYGVLGGRGGGIYVTGDDVVIEANLIQGNSATGGSNYFGGAGISIAEGDVDVFNNIVTGNEVGGSVTHGSGITVYGCQPTLAGNTIAANTGGAGEGLYVLASASPGQPILNNTIVASQTIGVNVDSGSAQNLATLFGVLWWNNGSNTDGTVYVSSQHAGDPLFINPASDNYHIGSGSAAINVGLNGKIPAGVTTDLDGKPRIANGVVDLGADEFDGFYRLKVIKAGNGSGKVTSSPVGIDCGADCAQSFNKNTVVTLTATAETGSTFGGWSGHADCTDGQVTMYADKTCTATFNSPITKTFRSQAAYDGWVLESSGTSSKGGTMNAAATTIYLGDDAQDRQYRSILSFDTSSLPDNATITSIVLKIKKQGLVGADPFTTHQYILVDIRKGAFSVNNALQLTDFQAAASKSNAGTIQNTPVSGWYSSNLGSSAFTYINLTGITQFRLRFKIDDNDDLGADYLKFYSGNHATISLRPLLELKYIVP